MAILILLITLLLIQNVQNVCISSSTLAESIIKSSPSLCFNNNDTNILNHRLIDESLSINSSIITQPSLSKSIENVAESRQIPVARSKLIKNNNNNNGGNGRKKKRKVYKIHGHHHYHPTTTTTMVERLPIQRQRKKSIFIPVALYSVTKKLPKNSNANLPRKISSSSNVSIRRNPLNYQDNFDGQDNQQQDGDDYEMRKESAVYGYIEKPEVIEFKGQYYYGGSGGGGANSGNGNDENNQNDDQSGGGDNIGGRIVSSSDHDNDNIIVDDGYPSPPMMDIHRHYDEDHHPPSSTYLPSSSNDYHLNDYHHHNHEPYHHHHGGDYYDHHNYHDMPSSSSAYPMMSPMYHHHHDSYDDHFEPSISTLLAAKLKKILLVKGITAKGLLLASIPLLLSPLLSYMLTPVVIPITATVAAGRRRRRKRQIFPSTTTISDDNDMDDIEIILKFLQPIFQQNDLWLNKAVANFLNHDGFFQTNDHCFEQLACQIVDDYHQDHHYLNSPSSKTSKLDKYQNTRRVAASLILKHLLQNEFVTKNFKKRIEKIIIQQKHRVEKKQWWKQCSNQYKCNRFVKKKIKQNKTNLID